MRPGLETLLSLLLGREGDEPKAPVKLDPQVYGVFDDRLSYKVVFYIKGSETKGISLVCPPINYECNNFNYTVAINGVIGLLKNLSINSIRA